MLCRCGNTNPRWSNQCHLSGFDRSNLAQPKRKPPVSQTEIKSTNRTKRRYFLLIAVIILVAAGWSGAWLYGRSVLSGQIASQLDGMERTGLKVACSELGIAGYPFRYEVHCDDLTSQDRLGSAGKLKGLNAVALVYNPWHVIFEAKAPASVAIPIRGAAGNLTWDTARASIKFASSALGAVDAVIDKPEAAFEDAFSSGVFEADKAEIHLRTAPGAPETLEGFASVDGLKLLSLPELQAPLQMRGHVQIEGGSGMMAGMDLATLVQISEGALPVRLVLLETLVGDSRVNASGDLVVGGDGTLSGNLEISLVEADALLAALKPLFPPNDTSYAMIENIVNSLKPAAVEVEGVATITLPVALEQGSVRLGFLPLGKIPPLFQVGS